MKIGQAFYCDGCGVNIYSGSHCNECDPQNGSEQVVITFTAIAPDDNTPLEQAISLGDFVRMAEPYRQHESGLQPEEEHKPWWKIF